MPRNSGQEKEKSGKNNRCRYFFTEKLAKKLKKAYICTVKNLKKV